MQDCSIWKPATSLVFKSTDTDSCSRVFSYSWWPSIATLEHSLPPTLTAPRRTTKEVNSSSSSTVDHHSWNFYLTLPYNYTCTQCEQSKSFPIYVQCVSEFNSVCVVCCVSITYNAWWTDGCTMHLYTLLLCVHCAFCSGLSAILYIHMYKLYTVCLYKLYNLILYWLFRAPTLHLHVCTQYTRTGGRMRKKRELCMTCVAISDTGSNYHMQTHSTHPWLQTAGDSSPQKNKLMHLYMHDNEFWVFDSLKVFYVHVCVLYVHVCVLYVHVCGYVYNIYI